MKVSELVSLTYDKIVLYKQDKKEFIDIFKGFSSQIASNFMQMEVRVFGSKQKGILDIEVR